MRPTMPGATRTRRPAASCQVDLPRQISLLHLAVCRGSAAMLETLIPVVKSAHQRPVRKGKPPIDGIPWQDARAEAQGLKGLGEA